MFELNESAILAHHKVQRRTNALPHTIRRHKIVDVLVADREDEFHISGAAKTAILVFDRFRNFGLSHAKLRGECRPPPAGAAAVEYGFHLSQELGFCQSEPLLLYSEPLFLYNG